MAVLPAESNIGMTGAGFLARTTAGAGKSSLHTASQAKTLLGITTVDVGGLGSLATQSGTFSGSSSGTNTGDQTTVTGNAGTATTLQTARAINGVSFDGSASITVTAAGSTLSDTVTVAKGGTGLTALGTALQVLRVNAGATALEFGTAGTGTIGGSTGSVASRVLVASGTGGSTLAADSAVTIAGGNITNVSGISASGNISALSFTATTAGDVFLMDNKAGGINFGASYGSLVSTAAGQIALRSASGSLAGFIVGNAQGGVDTTSGNGTMVIGNLHSNYSTSLKINSGGTYANSQSAGHLYLEGGKNYAGGTNSNGGSVYIFGGLLSGTGTTGNVHLAWTDAAAVGVVLIGTGTSDGVSILQVAGRIGMSASTTARASLNIPSGTAPTSPVNGDIWSDGTDLKVRLGGTTYTLTKT